MPHENLHGTFPRLASKSHVLKKSKCEVYQSTQPHIMESGAPRWDAPFKCRLAHIWIYLCSPNRMFELAYHDNPCECCWAPCPSMENHSGWKAILNVRTNFRSWKRISKVGEKVGFTVESNLTISLGSDTPVPGPKV
jgi:hypothetical protein